MIRLTRRRILFRFLICQMSEGHVLSELIEIPIFGIKQIRICEDDMSNEFDVHYGEKEFRTVDAGIEAIEAVLTGEDIHAKERLLFYLDWYMDPYYKRDLSVIREPLRELLQRIVITDNEIDIVDEALHLLDDWTYGPYTILEKNIDNVAEEFLPTVLYLINRE